jgi:hypothetical protein
MAPIQILRVAVLLGFVTLAALLAQLAFANPEPPPPPPPPPECTSNWCQVVQFPGGSMTFGEVVVWPEEPICLGSTFYASPNMDSTCGDAITASVWANATTNCPTTYATNTMCPYSVTNWWVANGPGSFQASGGGLGTGITPTNCGQGTITFYNVWTNYNPCTGTSGGGGGTITAQATYKVTNVDIVENEKVVCVEDTVAFTLTNTCDDVTWEVMSQGLPGEPTVSGNSILAGTNWGVWTVIARSTENANCLDYASIKVLKIRINSPTRDPEPPSLPIQNNFVFDKTAYPNAQCVVVVAGSSTDQEEDEDLEWSLANISGSTLTSNPSPAKGGVITYTYTGLPLANNFGRKILSVTHPLGCSDDFYVDLFFDGNDDAVNHPGAGSGYTPNWFYYWGQTDARWAASPIYYNPAFIDQILPIIGLNPGDALGMTWFVAGSWRCYMHSYANDDGNLIIDGPLTANGKPWRSERLDGIDSFANVWRHEARHRTVLNYYWPNNGIVPGQTLPGDLDGDLLPDSVEVFLGPEVGGPFSPLDADTDGDGLYDGHDYIYWTQVFWNTGAADSQDWSHFQFSHKYYDY